MDNESYQSQLDYIYKADLPALNSLLKTYEDSLNDPFDDGDDGGDLAIINLSNICSLRIRELTEKETQKYKNEIIS